MDNKTELKKVVSAEAGITQRYLDYLLNGNRNARPGVAIRLQAVTSIHRSVWVFGTSDERKRQFNELLKRHGF